MRDYPIFIPSSLEEFESKIESIEGTPILLAGGTDIIVYGRSGLLPGDTVLVDITRLEELKGISEENGFIRIGALATHQEVAENQLVRSKGNALAEGCAAVGCLQIRNRATIGGNLGNASPCGDTFAPLVVLDADFVVRYRTQERKLKYHEFFTGPKKTVLKTGEILTHVLVPMRRDKDSFYAWLGQRRALAITKVSVALAGVLEGNVIKEARVALGAVGPTVLESKQAAAALIGNELTDDIMDAACESSAGDSSPICDLRSSDEYRRRMCAELLRKCLLRWREKQ